MKNININETGNSTSDRSQDYCATFDNYDGAPDAGHQCLGMGRSPEETIIHLKECCNHSKEDNR